MTGGGAIWGWRLRWRGAGGKARELESSEREVKRRGPRDHKGCTGERSWGKGMETPGLERFRVGVELSGATGTE